MRTPLRQKVAPPVNPLILEILIQTIDLSRKMCNFAGNLGKFLDSVDISPQSDNQGGHTDTWPVVGVGSPTPLFTHQR